MGIRRLGRQRALQLLYAMEFNDKAFAQTEEEFMHGGGAKWRKSWNDFSRKLAEVSHAKREDLDREISKALDNWKLDRLPRLDRLTLRMALCELRYFPAIPLRATINEYIELAKLYGTDDSPAFINGVLDKLGKAYAHKDFKKGPEPDEDEDDEEDAADDAADEEDE